MAGFVLFAQKLFIVITHFAQAHFELHCFQKCIKGKVINSVGDKQDENDRRAYTTVFPDGFEKSVKFLISV